MENLLDYLIYALMGQNAQLVNRGYGSNGRFQWMLSFGFYKDVTLVLDEVDVEVIKFIAANHTMDDEDRERYEKLFKLCQ